MSGANLLDEFAGYADAVTDLHHRRLEALGVPRDWLRDPMAPTRYGVARATLRGDGTWEPADTGGTPVLVLPEPPLALVTDPAWPVLDLSDLIALRTDAPGRWWFRTRHTALLNADAPLEAMYRDQPLILHPDPLAWMRAGGAGAVVLDWRAHLPLHLGGAPGIRCTTRALAARVDAALHRPPHRHRIEAPPREAA